VAAVTQNQAFNDGDQTLDRLPAGKSGISFIPDLKELSLWRLEMVATIAE
jgi:hypothetical protein